MEATHSRFEDRNFGVLGPREFLGCSGPVTPSSYFDTHFFEVFHVEKSELHTRNIPLYAHPVITDENYHVKTEICT